MLETELFLPVKKLLEESGFTVYSEVVFKQSQRTIDVVGLNDALQKSVAVELKTSFNKKVLEQAAFNAAQFDFSYVAIPHFKPTARLPEAIGVILVNLTTQRAMEVKGPISGTFRPPYQALKDRLLLTGVNQVVQGGVAASAAISGKGVTLAQIINYLITHGETPLEELLKGIKTHYKHPKKAILALIRDSEELTLREKNGQEVVGLKNSQGPNSP